MLDVSLFYGTKHILQPGIESHLKSGSWSRQAEWGSTQTNRDSGCQQRQAGSTTAQAALRKRSETPPEHSLLCLLPAFPATQGASRLSLLDYKGQSYRWQARVFRAICCIDCGALPKSRGIRRKGKSNLNGKTEKHKRSSLLLAVGVVTCVFVLVGTGCLFPSSSCCRQTAPCEELVCSSPERRM